MFNGKQVNLIQVNHKNKLYHLFFKSITIWRQAYFHYFIIVFDPDLDLQSHGRFV